MATEVTTPESSWVLVEEFKDKGIITLNRPQALNAYSYEMSQKISNHINKWQNTKSMIIIKGNGGKAFCAGGDVKRMSQNNNPTAAGRGMSRIVYSMNYMIGCLKIPYIAFIDGITMGGGAGLSVHGKYRIATERTVFAMPEVFIGYFPDVGSSYFLPRLQGKLGYYLGLTGSRLKGEDVWHAGLATHYCHSSKLAEIEEAILSLDNSNDVEKVLNYFCQKPLSEFSLSEQMDKINRFFDATKVEDIFLSLKQDNSEWANQTIRVLESISPKSLKITLRQLNFGRNLSLGECLQMEYRMRIRFTSEYNYHEGIRAVLIDKDKKPKWNPSRIEDVSEEMVSHFFCPLPNDEQLPINVKLISNL